MPGAVTPKSGCIIFDLDGTLVDGETLVSRALPELLPIIDDSPENLTRRYQGRKFAEIFDDIEQQFRVSLPEGFESTCPALASVAE